MNGSLHGTATQHASSMRPVTEGGAPQQRSATYPRGWGTRGAPAAALPSGTAALSSGAAALASRAAALSSGAAAASSVGWSGMPVWVGSGRACLSAWARSCRGRAHLEA
eukprot:184907-Chlamydomonas_euryale.AAC.2